MCYLLIGLYGLGQHTAFFLDQTPFFLVEDQILLKI